MSKCVVEVRGTVRRSDIEGAPCPLLQKDSCLSNLHPLCEQNSSRVTRGYCKCF